MSSVRKIKILAVETSCDETALALVEASGGSKSPKFEILKNVVSSQTKIHAHWGGVVPNLAKREHIKNLPMIFRKIFESKVKSQRLKVDVVAVTVGPGLEPALWTGVNFAKEIHEELTTKNQKLKPKLVGVNHLEGHLYSFLLAKDRSYVLKNIRTIFPAIALIVSGGHTILLKMDSLTKWKKLGETRDDAVGEAFDKVARMLGLPYPGGPEIEKLAARSAVLGKRSASEDYINFPRPMMDQKNYDFSFSGLKTAVLYYLRDKYRSDVLKNVRTKIKQKKIADIAASFQKAAIDVLVSKTIRAAREFGARSVILSGGVASNGALRRELKVKCQKLKVNFFAAPKKFNTDNAVMIAVAGYIQYLQNKKRLLRAQGNLNL